MGESPTPLVEQSSKQLCVLDSGGTLDSLEFASEDIWIKFSFSQLSPAPGNLLYL